MMKIISIPTLMIASMALTAIADNASLVSNGSFEDYTGTQSTDKRTTISASFYPDGWTWSGTKMALTQQENTLCSKPVPDGTLALDMQGECSIEQSVTVETKGTYELSFSYVGRTQNEAYMGGIIVAYVDSVEVGRVQCTTNTFQDARWRIALESGSHKLKFSHDTSSGGTNPCSNIDMIEMRLVDEDNLISNSSFELYRTATDTFTSTQGNKAFTADKFQPRF